MEPVVPLEGVQKLRAGADHHAPRHGDADGHRRGGAGVPLDGRSVLFATLDRETLLIAGVGDAYAGNLQVILNDDPKAAVPCMLVTLPVRKPASANKTPFIAVLSLRQMRGETLDRVTIRSHGHSYPYILKHGPVDFPAFLGFVGEVSKQPEAEVVDSLVEALLSGKSAVGGAELAAKVVRSIAGQDGFIEVVGSFDEGDAYVQGWAKGLAPGSCRVFVLGDGLTVADLTSGLFERKDTGGRAFGFSGLLSADVRLNANAIRSVVFRGRSGWSTLDVHERRSVLEANGIPGQIRALLPRLSGAGEGRGKLLAAAHRFDGRETVSELDAPVRIGIDFGAMIDRGGVILSGWLLNPEDRVEAVYFRSANRSFRIDDMWTSQARPDVTSAFEELSPFLRGAAAAHRHGFLAFLRCEPDVGTRVSYLEIVLKNGQSAYAPLALGTAPLRTAFRRLVASLDPATALSSNVVERQFVPLLCEVGRTEPVVSETVDIGQVPHQTSKSVVIGIDDDVEKALMLLPLLALDPFMRGIPLVLAGPAAALGEQLEEIKRLAGFYGLAVRAVLATNVEDKLDTVEAGIAAAPSETVVCLNSSLVPRNPGWLEPLLSAFHARDGVCVVAPTILYEDDTIRWAGSWIDEEGSDAVLKQHYVGYPRRTLHGAEVCEVTAATFDCCVLPKSAMETMGGFTRRYLGTDEKGTDAALKLRVNGVPSIWVPQVEMVHPEDGFGGERNWQKLVSVIDRKVFDRTWSAAIPRLAGAC